MILLVVWAVALAVFRQTGQMEAGTLFAWATALPILVLLPTAALILTILAAVTTPSKPGDDP
jgi:hypothetical protein